ncbi:MAG: hypothetical protein JWO72_545, partial [Caulobacteraceae bacterium]|nr:hypothetical protein [Caulobacteraceae bacterium]
VSTSGAKSTLVGFTDASLKTLNVSGSSVLAVTNATSATAITVTGAAGFAGAVNDTTTVFNASGSTGLDTITIAADATKAITAGTGTSDEIIANAAGGTFTASKTGAKVTGFEVLGLTAGTTGTTDASVFGASINKIDVTATAVSSTLTNVNQSAAINFGSAATTTTALVVGYADVSGMSDAVTVTLAGAATSTVGTGAAQVVTSLTLQDANNVGIGTVSLVDNNPAFNYAGDTITTLVDPNLGTLNFSGVGGLTIGALTDTATAVAINNTGTNAAGLTITMTDNTLGSLTFNGTGKTSVNLSDTVGGTLALTNNGSGAVSVTDTNLVATKVLLSGAMTATLTDGALTSLNLSDGQAVNLTDGNTTGITISGASDNSHVSLVFAGAAAAATDTITLGNGNNSVTDSSTAGTVNVTVGSGANLINVSAGTAVTYAANVTLGAHVNTATAFDLIDVSISAAAAPSAVITGVATGDQITFKDAFPVVLTTLTALQQAVITGDATLAAAVGHAFGYLPATAHDAATFVWQGNTYVVENVAADSAFNAGADTVIELVGVHTIATTIVNGTIAILT